MAGQPMAAANVWAKVVLPAPAGPLTTTRMGLPIDLSLPQNEVEPVGRDCRLPDGPSGSAPTDLTPAVPAEYGAVARTWDPT